MVFPADEAGDGVALFHAGVLENPVVGFRAGPVATAVERHDTAGADDVALVGPTPAPVLGEDTDGRVDFLVGEAAGSERAAELAAAAVTAAAAARRAGGGGGARYCDPLLLLKGRTAKTELPHNHIT